MGTTGVYFYQIELKLFRGVIADTKLKRFQHNILKARKKTTLTIGEFRVTQPIAHFFAMNE